MPRGVRDLPRPAGVPGNESPRPLDEGRFFTTGPGLLRAGGRPRRRGVASEEEELEEAPRPFVPFSPRDEDLVSDRFIAFFFFVRMK